MQLTDVAAHIQLLPPTADAQEKLRLVVRLCLAHAFGSIWMLSVVEVFTRAKLNIIGACVFVCVCVRACVCACVCVCLVRV